MFGHKPRQIGAAKGGHPLGRPKDGAAKGLVGVGHLLQPVKDDVVGRIQRLPDFLQDDMALGLDLFGVEHRVQNDIGNHIQRQRHIGRQDAGVIGCHLAAGIGVDIAAHILDLFGDAQGTAPLGALEGHMFKEMRDAVLFGPLVPPAGRHPNTRGCRQ